MKFKMEIIARNIVNPEAITKFIIKVSKGQSDKIKIWCNTILKNYLRNEYDNLKEVIKIYHSFCRLLISFLKCHNHLSALKFL